jgi:hypothetical protein
MKVVICSEVFVCVLTYECDKTSQIQSIMI